MTQRLALACARHPWLTVGAWISAIVVALLLVSTLLSGNLTSEGKVTNNPESLRGYDLQAERDGRPRRRAARPRRVVRRLPTDLLDAHGAQSSAFDAGCVRDLLAVPAVRADHVDVTVGLIPFLAADDATRLPSCDQTQ